MNEKVVITLRAGQTVSGVLLFLGAQAGKSATIFRDPLNGQNGCVLKAFNDRVDDANPAIAGGCDGGNVPVQASRQPIFFEIANREDGDLHLGFHFGRHDGTGWVPVDLAVDEHAGSGRQVVIRGQAPAPGRPEDMLFSLAVR
jgi:hypothetical protein